VTTRWKKPGTAIAATAWIAACSYLHFAWPSLAPLLETLDSSPGIQRIARVPRIAFLVSGLVVALALKAKDRWMGTSMSLVTDAVIGAPAFTLIALLIQPFLIDVE